MARSLIGGLVADGVDASLLSAADPVATQRAALASAFGIETHDDNAVATRTVSTLVLAVKPQVLRDVARQIAPSIAGRDVLVISIAAGIRTADIERWLGAQTPVVRAMPNTPALLGCGVTGLFANDSVTASQRETAESILRAVGSVFWFAEENALDAVTALSGSGPAYFFLFMQVVADAGEQLGLERETARLLAIETAIGAGRMALESDDDLETLRQRVTSPGGTTQAALEVLDTDELRALVTRALQSAQARAGQLADQFGGGDRT